MKNTCATVLSLFPVACLAMACSRTARPPRDVSSCVEWRDGDIVFRRGTGIAGHAVIALDGNAVFSHVGLVILRGDTPMVVHAVPGEPDHDGDPDRVKLEPVNTFFSRERATEGAVMRHHDTVQAARAARVALRAYEDGVLFDHAYDDSDTTRLYCTELVTYAYARAGLPLYVHKHAVNLPGVAGEVVFPSDVAACPELQLVYHF